MPGIIGNCWVYLVLSIKRFGVSLSCPPLRTLCSTLSLLSGYFVCGARSRFFWIQTEIPRLFAPAEAVGPCPRNDSENRAITLPLPGFIHKKVWGFSLLPSSAYSVLSVVQDPGSFGLRPRFLVASLPQKRRDLVLGMTGRTLPFRLVSRIFSFSCRLTPVACLLAQSPPPPSCTPPRAGRRLFSTLSWTAPFHPGSPPCPGRSCS